MAPQWMLARVADIKGVAAAIFPCYQPRKKVGLEIQLPTDFRRLDVKLEGLTPEQQVFHLDGRTDSYHHHREAFLRQKAAIETLSKPMIPPLPTTFTSARLPSGYTSASAPSSPRTIVATTADFSSSADATSTIPAHPDSYRGQGNTPTFTRESSAPFIPTLFSFSSLHLPQPAASSAEHEKPPVPPRSAARETCKWGKNDLKSSSAPDLRRPQARDGAEVSRLDRARGTARRWRWSAGLRARWKEAHPIGRDDFGPGVVGWNENVAMMVDDDDKTTETRDDGAKVVLAGTETTDVHAQKRQRERIDEGFEVQVVKGASGTIVSVKSLILGRDSVTLRGSERDCDFEIVGSGQEKEVRA